jgi:glycosyltransferase involved in cell wall biosynthesis
MNHGLRVLVAGYADPARPPVLAHWKDIPVKTVAVSRSRLPGALFFLVFMFKLFRLARRERPGIYYACDLPVLFPFYLASRFRKGVLIYDSREIFTELPGVHDRPLKKRLWGLLERIALRGVSKSLVVCDSDRRDLTALYPSLRPVIVRNLPCYAPYVKRNLLREKLGLPPGTPVILYQGSLLESGGVPELVLAMAQFEQGHLVIIGDGPERPAVEKSIRDHHLEHRVSLLPPVPFTELHPLSCSADIGCYTGKGEGKNLVNVLPNKIFEYAMAGLPMILSDLPELRKINGQYQVGVLMPAITPEAIAAAVGGLLADAGNMARLKANALIMAKTMCWENEEKTFLTLFNL